MLSGISEAKSAFVEVFVRGRGWPVSLQALYDPVLVRYNKCFCFCLPFVWGVGPPL